MSNFRVGKKIVNIRNIISEIELIVVTDPKDFINQFIGKEGYFGNSLDEIMFCVKENLSGTLNAVDCAPNIDGKFFIKDEIESFQKLGYKYFLSRDQVKVLTPEEKETCEVPTWKSKTKELQEASTHPVKKTKLPKELKEILKHIGIDEDNYKVVNITKEFKSPCGDCNECPDL